MSEIGILTDFEGSTARIDDKPIGMFDAAAGYCKKHWPMWKKCKVEYELRDGKISKIWLAAEANKQPQQQATVPATKETCTSPEKPAASAPKNDNGLPKTIDGKISVITPDARTFNLWREDFKLKITWTPGQDAMMAKFKQWDPVKVTYEPGTVNKLVDIVGEKKGGFGGKTFTPRNEKPMIYESAFKSCVDLVRDTDFPGMDYAARVEAVRAEADKIAKWIAKEGGA